MSLLAAIVVVAFGFFLIGLTGVVFAKPALAERFFMSFESSARTHYMEQAFRLLIGASLVLLSPAMSQPAVFRLFGWAIVVTSVGLILIPWQWRHRLFAFGAFCSLAFSPADAHRAAQQAAGSASQRRSAFPRGQRR